MRMPTETALFRIDRRLGKVRDFVLPFGPWSLSEALALLLGLAADALVWKVRGGSADDWWLLPWPPAVAVVLARRPLRDGKLLHAWLLSQLRWRLLEPRRLWGMQRAGEPERLQIRLHGWRPLDAEQVEA